MDKGVFGDNDHSQRLDNLDFRNRPDKIVFRRSVPHSGQWVDHIPHILTQMVFAGYEIIFVTIEREKKYNALSQVKRSHAADVKQAENKIDRGRKEIAEFTGKQKWVTVEVFYESFVANPVYRANIADKLGLPIEETMAFYNANARYE
jgi:hypothetical protein